MHASLHTLPAPVPPLLKWAGGKRQLLQQLSAHYPDRFDRYVEPFFGSGAVFFDLFSSGRLAGVRAQLSDVNPDLIGCYVTLRDRPEEVIEALAGLEREHRARGDACYYEVRDRRFNPQRAALSADAAVAARSYTPELAAMLIFLNRTGFNGLFRLNRLGAFNVPAGRYTDPRICDPDHVRAVAGVLRRPGVAIEHRGFEEALTASGAGDFVYCDPPYAPLSKTSSFANYTAAGFAALDQERLQHAVVGACRRGAHVVMSNSSAPEIELAYRSRAARQAKIAVYRVPARRAINSRGSSRGPVDELIITNVPGRRSGAIDKLRRTRPTMLKIGLHGTMKETGVDRVPPSQARARRTRQPEKGAA